MSGQPKNQVVDDDAFSKDLAQYANTVGVAPAVNANNESLFGSMQLIRTQQGDEKKLGTSATIRLVAMSGSPVRHAYSLHHTVYTKLHLLDSMYCSIKANLIRYHSCCTLREATRARCYCRMEVGGWQLHDRMDGHGMAALRDELAPMRRIIDVCRQSRGGKLVACRYQHQQR